MPSPMPLVEPVTSDTLSLSEGVRGRPSRSVMAMFMARHSLAGRRPRLADAALLRAGSCPDGGLAREMPVG